MVTSIVKSAFKKFALAIAIFSTNFTSINAQSINSVNKVEFIPPPPPSRGVPSGRQQGGASRGNCPTPVESRSLTALVPAMQNLNKNSRISSTLNTWESVWGLTTVASPTFWFYVPYALTSKLPIIFVLQDEQGKNIYKTSLTTSRTQPSITKISLPSEVTLDVGKMYRWYFVVDCHPDAPPQVNGWVQRTTLSPTLSRQLQTATPQQRAALYASNGIWYDALTTLAQLRNLDPKNAQLLSNWVSLLNSAGLGAIARESISDCCTD